MYNGLGNLESGRLVHFLRKWRKEEEEATGIEEMGFLGKESWSKEQK